MFARLSSGLPIWASNLIDVVTRPEVILLLGAGSLGLFVLSLLGVPWFLARVPKDYFAARSVSAGQAVDRGPSPRPDRRRDVIRLALHALKNLLGVALLLVGIVMLFAPGQGLLVLFVSTFFLDFPGKHAAQRWIVGRPPVLRAVNALRQRRGRPPLVL